MTQTTCTNIPASNSNLRYALINSAFSVLLQQSVLFLISEYFSFVCLFLYRFIKSFKGSFLATLLESRYQHWPYWGVGSVSFLAEKAKN